MKSVPSTSVVLAALATFVAWCGCGRDARLAGEELRRPVVRTATHYGLTLDPSAPPEKVAAVALRAIREDVLAQTPAERKSAQDIQFDLCAADAIASRNNTALSRDEFIHYVVTEWAPTVSYYVNDFNEDIERLAARMVNRSAAKLSAEKTTECELAMEVTGSDGDPNGRVVMLIWMIRDNGYWRVSHFGFEPRRSLGAAGAANPSVDRAKGDQPSSNGS